ncbi:hypothetical protein NUKP68_53520 [Klebsiella variicola]|nr:hypothetical protein NUKP68_53520 [Klebsiella variicola]
MKLYNKTGSENSKYIDTLKGRVTLIKLTPDDTFLLILLKINTSDPSCEII